MTSPEIQFTPDAVDHALTQISRCLAALLIARGVLPAQEVRSALQLSAEGMRKSDNPKLREGADYVDFAFSDFPWDDIVALQALAALPVDKDKPQ